MASIVESRLVQSEMIFVLSLNALNLNYRKIINIGTHKVLANNVDPDRTASEA